VVTPYVRGISRASTDHQGPEATYLQKFGLSLKLQRVKAGLTQEQLADRAGMHRTFIGLVERGESGLSIERLVDLAAALDVEPADLLPPRPGSHL
jgi:transcriptional regulator with XRE-family HTH domain